MNGYSTPTLRAMARARHLALAPVVWTVMLTAASSQAQSVSGSLGIHDPSTVVKSNGKYFLYGTGTGIISKQSSDHFTWSDGPPVFTSAPSWIAAAVPANSDLNYWAPDVAYFNNLYHLYYSVSTFGKQVSAIGLATSPTLDPADPSYHWTDQGAVIQSTNGSPYNTIDPSITQMPDGHVWMSFGSFWNGIYMTELDPTSGKQTAPRFAHSLRCATFAAKPRLDRGLVYLPTQRLLLHVRELGYLLSGREQHLQHPCRTKH